MTSSGNPKNSEKNSVANTEKGSLSVSELSRRTGVTTATINYYVRIGVLPPPRKTSRTRALYPVHFENLIVKIKELQTAGLNLKGIKQLVNGDPSSPLAAAMPSQQSNAASPQSVPTGPISIADFLTDSGLDDDLYDNLIGTGLIRRPRTGPDGAPAHDRRDLSAARAFARLASAGNIQFSSVTPSTVHSRKPKPCSWQSILVPLPAALRILNQLISSQRSMQ